MLRRGLARLAPGVTWAKTNPAVGTRLPCPTPPEGTGVVFMFDHVNYKYALPNNKYLAVWSSAFVGMWSANVFYKACIMGNNLENPPRFPEKNMAVHPHAPEDDE